MPTKVVPPVDVAMYRASRLLEAIRGAVPPEGVSSAHLKARLLFSGKLDAYTAPEARAASTALRECGALVYKRGIYTRGEMF